MKKSKSAPCSRSGRQSPSRLETMAVPASGYRSQRASSKRTGENSRSRAGPVAELSSVSFCRWKARRCNRSLDKSRLHSRREDGVRPHDAEQENTGEDDGSDDRHGSKAAGVRSESRRIECARRQFAVKRRLAGNIHNIGLNSSLQNGRHGRDAGRATELTQQVVYPRRVCPQLRGEGGKSERAEGSEEQPDPDSLERACRGHPDFSTLSRHSRHQGEAASRDQKPQRQQGPMIDPIDQVTNSEHGRHRSDAARRQRQTGLSSIVAEGPLAQRGQKDDGRKEKCTNHEVVKN